MKTQDLVDNEQSTGVARALSARGVVLFTPPDASPSTHTESVRQVPTLSPDDSRFLAYLRGVAILAIVVGHLGGWVFPPYTQFVAVFVPVFFFLSGAVSYYSYQRSQTTLKYLVKRIGGILVPYWMLCVFWLAVYLVVNATVPAFSASALLRWLTFRPNESAALFTINQVWFLHTLVIILIVSPALFELYRRQSRLLIALMVIPIVLATIQMFQDVHEYLNVMGNNFYKPVVHSVFFVLGFVYFTSPTVRKKSLAAGLGAIALLLSLCLVTLFHQDVNCSPHTFSPDLYYVAVSLCAIAGLLLSQPWCLQLCDTVAPARITLSFLHRYTFPIFLLHSFAIYVSEDLFGLVHPEGSYFVYALTKCGMVMLLTCVLAVPFGATATWLAGVVLRRRSPILPTGELAVVDEISRS